MRFAAIFAMLPTAALLTVAPVSALEPIPDGLIVLTFDDSAKSHYTMVRPILKRHGFGATFFITEGFEFADDKKNYMTWQEIARLHEEGFGIGNHTRDHPGITKENVESLEKQVAAVGDRCREHGIPRPTSFAWPGNGFELRGLPILKKLGIRFGRRGGSPEYAYEDGGGVAYEPGLDHPLLIPSVGDARPDWTIDDFKRAIEPARHGRIAVLQFHGVPDRVHPWVHTPVEKFQEYMEHLAAGGYRVIAMRDLARYVDPDVVPQDPMGVVEDRRRMIASGKSREDFRRPKDEDDLHLWLENMVRYHRFTLPEVSAATGLPADEIHAALKRFGIERDAPAPRGADSPLLVLPYPGGRHPRIGFLDGMIRPQRETKLSVFAPWAPSSYVVLDLPEAIWHDTPQGRQLLYLAHTHIPTIWDRQGIALDKLEWQRGSDGTLCYERRLPNAVAFGTRILPGKDAVRMEMWLSNGTDTTLSGLDVQNCMMLKGATEFAHRGNDNKVSRKPYMVCRSAEGDRWVITAWVPCGRCWGNADCPCLHSDPRFPDCPPGETRRLRGWLSFYEGTDLEAELRRIEATGWRECSKSGRE